MPEEPRIKGPVFHHQSTKSTKRQTEVCRFVTVGCCGEKSRGASAHGHDAVLLADGAQHALGVGGYLDIGLLDTMKDLFVNFVGAVVFSVIGYFYVKSRGRGRFARRFIPRVMPEDRAEES